MSPTKTAKTPKPAKAALSDSAKAAPQDSKGGGDSYYIPSRARFSTAIVEKEIDGKPYIALPQPLFAHFMLLLLENSAFNEDFYLNNNEDVKTHVAGGSIPSGKEHYASHGFLESRKACFGKFDTIYYLNTYPDVARAIYNGEYKSCEEHWFLKGEREGRFCNAEAEKAISRWSAEIQNALK